MPRAPRQSLLPGRCWRSWSHSTVSVEAREHRTRCSRARCTERHLVRRGKRGVNRATAYCKTALYVRAASDRFAAAKLAESARGRFASHVRRRTASYQESRPKVCAHPAIGFRRALNIAPKAAQRCGCWPCFVTIVNNAKRGNAHRKAPEKLPNQNSTDSDVR